MAAPSNVAQSRSFFTRQRTPLLLAIVSGSAFFIGMKWRAVIQRSEAAKQASSKDINYSVATGRSGGGI